MNFLRKYIEILIIVWIVINLALVYLDIGIGYLLIVISLALLSFYYLLSGIMVMFNKQVLRGMRLIYFAGLWSISVGILGVTYRLRLWYNSEIILMIAILTGIVILAIIALYYQTGSAKEKPVLSDQLKPVTNRLMIYVLVFLFFRLISLSTFYDYFHPLRDDLLYKSLYMNAVENPQDETAQRALEEYEQIILEQDDN